MFLLRGASLDSGFLRAARDGEEALCKSMGWGKGNFYKKAQGQATCAPQKWSAIPESRHLYNPLCLGIPLKDGWKECKSQKTRRRAVKRHLLCTDIVIAIKNLTAATVACTGPVKDWRVNH